VDARSDYSILYLIISIFMVAWLGIDFTGTFLTGETLMMRVDGKISFNQAPFLFVFTIAVKLVVMIYSLLYIFKAIVIFYGWVVRRPPKKHISGTQRKKVKKSLKKKRGY